MWKMAQFIPSYILLYGGSRKINKNGNMWAYCK